MAAIDHRLQPELRGGDAAACQFAAIHAQWGDRARALERLDTAMRLRDPE